MSWSTWPKFETFIQVLALQLVNDTVLLRNDKTLVVVYLSIPQMSLSSTKRILAQN